MAESAGVSLGVPGEHRGRCFWRAASGRWRAHVGTEVDIEKTPCGVVIERNTAVLFHDPGRYFSEPDIAPGIHEILLVPLRAGGDAVGAVWAASHSPDRAFEQEDVRLLLRLGALASIAYRLENQLAHSEEERADAIADLQQAKDRLRQMVDGVPLLLWRADDTGRWTWAGPQWTQLTGQACEASLGQGWLDPVHPEDRRRARRAWRLAKSAQSFSVGYRIYDLDADRYRWFQTRASPVRDENDEIVEWLGTSSDIDDLETLRDHQRTLLAELQHRVRNTLAVVRSIARRTIERSDTIEEFQMHFDGRIGAFARAQSLVARDPSAGIDLETLIAEELLAHHAHEGDRLTIAGPPVRLDPRIADMLGLAIHELAVNAVKYGGLSSERGHVEVRWDVEDTVGATTLALTWRDSNPERPEANDRHYGFGRELIERSLAYDLDAVTDLAIGPDGVRCDIRLPLNARAGRG